MLDYRNHREDPARWAHELGISLEAVQLYLASEVVDLHIDSFIWHRVFGYDLGKRHGAAEAGSRRGWLGRSFWGHADLPRIREAQIGAAVWTITTNPVRSAAGRARALLRNVAAIQAVLARADEEVELVRDVAEHRAARSRGKHAAMLGIQGGNALGPNLEALTELPERAVLLVTLVHLSSSALGTTSSPLRFGSDSGLSDLGRELVRRLNDMRIFVDLAHLNRRGFFDAVEAHDRSQPLLVSHTGVSGAFAHWRNLDDEQLYAVADTGGLVGVLYHPDFLAERAASVRASTIVDHLGHVVQTIGEDFAALGSDWDGAITTPPDMPTCLELPRLVEIMLERGWKPERIQKVLGQNFLRVLKALRG